MKIRNLLLSVFCSLGSIGVALAKPIDIHFSGVKNPLVRQNIEAHLKPIEESQTDWDKNSLSNALKNAEMAIRMALKPYGYYEPIIHSHYSENDKAFVIDYEILSGTPIRIESLELQVLGSGKNLESQVFEHFPLKVGNRLQDPLYEQGKKAALAFLVNRGYLKASFQEHQILVDTQTHKAKIRLILESGPLYYFGPVQLNNTPFDESFLKRYVPFEPNAPFEGQRLTELQSALNNSQYFKSVNINPLFPVDDSRIVPIQTELRMREPNQYQIGLGYGTDTSVRGILNYKRRYLNRWGHQLGGSLAYSGLRDRMEVFYTIPGKHPDKDNYQIRLSNTDERFDNKSSLYRIYDVIENRAIGDWTRTLQLQYYEERFKEYVGESTEQNHFLLPSMTWTKTVADHLLTPSRGYKMIFGVKGALNTLFSENGFIQGNLQLKRIMTLPSYQRLLAHLEIGATYPGHIDDLPIGLRYFAGGDFSLRGYGYKRLGPTKYTPSGEKTVVGGRYLLLGGLEIQQPLWNKISLATFWDSGNAMNRMNEGLYNSLGVGIRYQSPIGAIRFDLAKPLRGEGNAWRIHFNIGADL